MHELSTVVRLVNLADHMAKEQNAGEVKSITVEIGEMTGILPEYVRKYFPEASAGTGIEGAELKIEITPVKSRCEKCQTVFHPDREHDYCCPVCGGRQCRIVSGRSCTLKRMELIIPDGDSD